MRTITEEYKLYTYNELSEEAKETVKEWYLNDDLRVDLFHEDLKNRLAENYKRSDLKVCFSLSSCQGDGLNIEGKINLYDFLEKWGADEKSKRTIEHYIDNSFSEYTFESNNRYAYSCKFIDRKYIDDTITEFIEDLKYNCIRGIKTDIVKAFFNDLIDHFEELDEEWEKAGYKYFYDAEESEVKEYCEANNYEFLEDGTFYA